MKRFLAAWAAALLPWTGLCAAAGEGLPQLTNDWFAITFADRAVGEVLSDLGATGGSWGAVIPPAGMIATNALEGTRHYLAYDTSLGIGDLDFTATKASAGFAQKIDFSASFRETDSPFAPEDGDRAALTVARDGSDAVTFFAYGIAGWTAVSTPYLTPAFDTWYDCRILLESVDDALYATYQVLVVDRYETLRDANGRSRFRAAGAGTAWQRLALRGVGDAGDSAAKDIAIDTAHTFYWIGGATGLFSDGANWSHASRIAIGQGLKETTNGWFSVTFKDRAVGEVLSDAGATGGSWGDPPVPEGAVATNALDGSRHYLAYDTFAADADSGLDFTAAATASGVAQITDFPMSFSEADSPFELQEGDRTALTVCRTDDAVSFFVYGADGWVPVSATGVSAAFGTWYDFRATMEAEGGVLYATYAVKAEGAATYATLYDANGRSRFPAAGTGTAWKHCAFRGIGGTGDFASKDISVDPRAGAAPGADDTAVVSTNALITLGDDTVLAGLRVEKDASFTGASLSASSFSGDGFLTVSNATLVLPFGTHVDKLALLDGAQVRLDMTGAQNGRVALRVDMCDGDLASALEVANVPEEYTCTTNANLAGGLEILNGEKDFLWLLGAGVQGDWSEPGNWGVGTEIATRAPSALDRVIFPDGASVNVDREAAALAVVARGTLTMTGVAKLDAFDFCVSNDVTLTGTLFTPYVNLTMTPAGTLSLGGTTNLLVRHFVGAGTVRDGVLLTGDNCYYQTGGSLTVPCVSGAFYRLWRKGYSLTLSDATEDDRVSVLVPATWFTDRQGGKRVLWCPGEVDWDVRGRTAGPPYRATESWLEGWWHIPADPDAEEAYIESDGTMAINTGYHATSNSMIVIDFQFTDPEQQQRAFGAASGTDASVGLSACLYITGGNKFGFAYCDGAVTSWGWITDVTFARTEATLDARTPGKTVATLVVSNQVYGTKNSNFSHTQRANWPLGLFANTVGPEGTNFTNFAKMRLYSFRIYEGDHLVRYWLPCREGDVIGLKDIFTQQFFTNVASGASFIAGGDVNVVPAWDESVLDGYRLENGVITGVRVRADAGSLGHGLVSLDGGTPALEVETYVTTGATAVVTAFPVDGRAFSKWNGDTDEIANGPFAVSAEIKPTHPAELSAWFGLRNLKDDTDPYAHGYLDRFYQKADGTWTSLWTDGCWTDYHNDTQAAVKTYGLDPTWWKNGYYPTNGNDRIHFQCPSDPDFYFGSWIDWPSGTWRFGTIAEASRQSHFNVRGTYTSSLHIQNQDSIYAIWQQENFDLGGGFLVDAENSPHRINRLFVSKQMSFETAGSESQATLGEVTGSGNLRKLGAGRLTLESAYRGGVRIQGGEVAIGHDAYPNELVSGAFAHFDASLTNTMTFALDERDGQMRLTKWTDADGGSVYLKGGYYGYQATWTNTWAGPVLGTRTVAGTRLVDFGAFTYGSADHGGSFVDDSYTPGELQQLGRAGMMSSSNYVTGELGSAFIVYEHPSRYGMETPIGWWSWSNSGYDFAIRADGAGALNNNIASFLYSVRLRENNRPLKGDRNQTIDYRDGHDFTVLSIVGEDRKLGWWYTGGHAGERQAGGIRMGEAIAYERVLTLAEQEQNSLFLQRKWHDRANNDVYPWTLDYVLVMPDTDEEACVYVGPGKTASVRTVHRPAWTEFDGQPLVKTGSGTLELDRVQDKIDISVRGGKVKFIRQSAKIGDNPQPAPHAHFWGDASRTDRFLFVKDAQGSDTAQVLSWLDCRDGCDVAMTNWIISTRNSSGALLPYKSPTLLKTGGLHDLPTVDFGSTLETYGARLALNTTTNKNQGGVGKAYVADKFDGFVVWRNIAPVASSRSTSVPYIFGDTIAAGWDREEGSLSRGLDTLDTGTIYPNGFVPGCSYWTVDGLLTLASKDFPDTMGRDDYVVIRLRPGAGFYLNAIGGNGGPNSNRLGGGVQIAEVLIYTYQLSDFQARQTEAYLMKKWKGVAHPDTGTGVSDDIGDVAFAPGIPGELDLESDRNFGIVSGTGTFTKSGTGTATIEALVGFDNVSLTGGTVVVEGDYTAPSTIEVTILEDGTLLGNIEVEGNVTVPDNGTLIVHYPGEGQIPRGSYRIISGASVTGGAGWTIECDHPHFEPLASKVRTLETSFNLEIGGKGFMIFMR